MALKVIVTFCSYPGRHSQSAHELQNAQTMYERLPEALKEPALVRAKVIG